MTLPCGRKEPEADCIAYCDKSIPECQNDSNKGHLKHLEPHPCAVSAMKWIIDNYTKPQLFIALEAYSSCAIEGNRLAEICSETLCRVLKGDKVSDRYLLGLAWNLRALREKK